MSVSARWTSRRRARLAVVGLAVLSASTLPASALPGDPDAAFSAYCDDGVAMFGDGTNAGASVTAASGTTYVAGVMQPGDIVTAESIGSPEPNDRLTISGVGPDGGLDLLSTLDVRSAGRSIALHPATSPTRAIVGGLSATSPILVAFNLEDGSIDTTFGTDGVVATGFGDTVKDLAVSSAGQIYGIAGDQLFRRTSSGAADTTFNTTGQVTVPFIPTQVAVNGDGVYVAGDGISDADAGWRLMRYTTVGLADPTFNTGSPVVTSFPAASGFTFKRARVRSLLLAAGKPVLAGSATFDDGSLTFPSDLALARYTSTGALDSGFSADGLVTLSVSSEESVDDVVVDGSSRVVGAGTDVDGARSLLFRLSDAGALDSAMGVTAFGSTVTRTVGVGIVPSGSIAVTYSSTEWFGPAVSVSLRHGEDVTRGAAAFAHTGFGFPVDTGGGMPSCPLAGEPPEPAEGSNVRDASFLVGTQTGYILHGDGSLRPFALGDRTSRPGPAVGQPFWPEWDIARSVAFRDDRGGYVLDAYGGLHSVGVPGSSPPAGAIGPYFGFDIARDVAFLPDGRGGYILDGWGGLHPFGVGANPKPAKTTGGPYWTGWDIARKVIITANGTGGYVLDGFGGVHRFAIGTAALPPSPSGGPYWNGWQIARDVALTSGGFGGYVLDGFGAIHPFALGAGPAPSKPAVTAYSQNDHFRALSLFGSEPPPPD